MPTATRADTRPTLLLDTSAAIALLTEAATGALGAELAERGIAGGSVYDALVAAAARHHARPAPPHPGRSSCANVRRHRCLARDSGRGAEPVTVTADPAAHARTSVR